MIISKDTPKTVKVNVCAFMPLAFVSNLFGILQTLYRATKSIRYIDKLLRITMMHRG